MKMLTGAPLPPPVHIPYSILILTKTHSGVSFLIQFLFKTDENTHWRPPLLPQYIVPFDPYSKLMKILTGGPLLPQSIYLIQFLGPILPHYIFLVQFVFKIHENTHWRPQPSPSTYSLSNPYSKLMKILTGGPLLPQYIFLIQFLF
jgi:hypothetical protein